jgi:hypothetical protein
LDIYKEIIMGLQRSDVYAPDLDDEEREIRKSLFARYLKCDEWAKKAQLPIGVLLTAHPGGRSYLKASIETHRKLGYWITLAYDNYFDPEVNEFRYDQFMPAMDVLHMVDTFIMPHHQTWGGVLYPYFWLMKFGLQAMKSFDYIYCANGDCILEKPEGFEQMLDMLGDGDIIGSSWERGHIFGTAAIIAKSEALLAIMEHVEKYFIPYDNYEKYTQDLGNCEARFGKAILDLGLKNVTVPENPYNEQLHKPGYGTWYKILGFRHIHGEHNYAYRYKGIPPKPEYFDERFIGDEYRLIKEYWEKEDIDILKDWWAKD